MKKREHHMGAVQMAQWQLEHGKDQKMKDMARIIADQKKEIAQFDQFLASEGHKPGAGAMGAGGAQGHGQLM